MILREDQIIDLLRPGRRGILQLACHPFDPALSLIARSARGSNLLLGLGDLLGGAPAKDLPVELAHRVVVPLRASELRFGFFKCHGRELDTGVEPVWLTL